MAKSIYEKYGVGGLVFVLACVVFIVGLKLDTLLSIIISAIAGLIAWQLTKKK